MTQDVSKSYQHPSDFYEELNKLKWSVENLQKQAEDENLEALSDIIQEYYEVLNRVIEMIRRKNWNKDKLAGLFPTKSLHEWMYSEGIPMGNKESAIYAFQTTVEARIKEAKRLFDAANLLEVRTSWNNTARKSGLRIVQNTASHAKEELFGLTFYVENNGIQSRYDKIKGMLDKAAINVIDPTERKQLIEFVKMLGVPVFKLWDEIHKEELTTKAAFAAASEKVSVSLAQRLRRLFKTSEFDDNNI